MRFFFILLLQTLLLPLLSSAQQCLSEILLQESISRNPAVAGYRQQLERAANQWITASGGEESARQIVTIPVVVHIVWNTADENISDEQVFSQIAALNEDYHLLNTDQALILPIFQALKADIEIQFVMAAEDPAGQPTNGITRTQTTIPEIGLARVDNKRRICYSILGGADAWCTNRYLNIWVGRFPDGIGGEASFPGQDIAAEDGVRIDPRHFGRMGTAMPPYHLGRTTTHEIGHYFNLYHPWGVDLSDCNDDDNVADTPKQSATYSQQCPTGIQITCGTPDMYQNYLNYTNDACMALFTLGQKLRIWATLNGPRASLLEGGACSVATNEPEGTTPVKIFPNPANQEFTIYCEDATSFTWELSNEQGQLLARHFSHNQLYTYSCEALPVGGYFIKIITGTSSTVKKLIVTH